MTDKNKPSDGPTLVTWGQIAAYCQCSLKTLFKRHKLDPIKTFRAPGSNVVQAFKRDVDNWLEGMKEGGR